MLIINVQGASPEYFSVLTLSVMAITAATTAAIKLLYDPTMRYVVLNRCTVEHSSPHSELRLLACVHNEDHVNPLLHLLEASQATLDSPISLTVLHLNELAGQCTTVLLPHKHGCHHHYSLISVASDRIMNAFQYFKQQQPESESFSLHPFLVIAPYSSMHNDICSLALDHQVSLILLPFHKHSDGTQQIANQAIQSLNGKVLNFAPCSVAILIDHCLPARAASCAYPNPLLHRVAVYFLGGPDDREALAFASRMTHKRSVTLTIIRFLPCKDDEAANNNEERKLDDAAMAWVRERFADTERLVYIEEEAKNGEDTAAVIHAMSEEFDLLIVGRRNGMETELTSGLSEWSECPELGVIGDMLAMEFAEKVTILVVQQHQGLRGRRRKQKNGGDSGRLRGCWYHFS